MYCERMKYWTFFRLSCILQKDFDTFESYKFNSL